MPPQSWVELRAEWVDAGVAETYTLSVPSAWKMKGKLLFGSADGPLLTEQLQSSRVRGQGVNGSRVKGSRGQGPLTP